MGKRETTSDIGKTLARFTDAIMARVFGHHEVEELAEAAGVPVINGLSDLHHPLSGPRRSPHHPRRARFFGRSEITYVGDGNNVAHSLAIGCALTGAPANDSPPRGPRPRRGNIGARRES